MAGTLSSPVTLWHNHSDRDAPLVVLLHGRGADETGIAALAEYLPEEASYVAVRAPIAEGPGFAWFLNQGVGRALPDSLAGVMDWFRQWLDDVAVGGRKVVLIGFSGGAAFAGGLALSDPSRYSGAAIMSGTIPFDAGVPTTPHRLDGFPVFLSQGEADTVIPIELQVRTRDYLENESGADLVISTDADGHTISEVAIERLYKWTTARISSAPKDVA